jgi:hypothetical protein
LSDYTDDEINTMLETTGLKRLEEERESLLTRIRCRIFGPHDWVPVMRYIPSTGALVEEGFICDRCHKESHG